MLTRRCRQHGRRVWHTNVLGQVHVLNGLAATGIVHVLTGAGALVAREVSGIARLGLIGVLSLGALAIVCVRVVTTADALRPHARATLRQLRT